MTTITGKGRIVNGNFIYEIPTDAQPKATANYMGRDYRIEKIEIARVGENPVKVTGIAENTMTISNMGLRWLGQLSPELGQQIGFAEDQANTAWGQQTRPERQPLSPDLSFAQAQA